MANSLGQRQADCWEAELRAVVRRPGLDGAPCWTAHMLQAQSIDVRTVLSAEPHAFSRQLQVSNGSPPTGTSVHAGTRAGTLHTC